MNITRDVISDLLLLYLEGESSPDTQALIKEFFKQDPEFEQLVQAGENEKLPYHEPSTKLPRDAEMLALEKTKKLLRKRSLMIAFGILFTLWAATVRFDGARVVWMWSGTPVIAVVLLIVGLGFWAGYFKTVRRLKSTGL